MKTQQELRDGENKLVCIATNNTEAQEMWKVFCRMQRKQQAASMRFVTYDDAGNVVRASKARQYRPRAKKGA